MGSTTATAARFSHPTASATTTERRYDSRMFMVEN